MSTGDGGRRRGGNFDAARSAPRKRPIPSPAGAGAETSRQDRPGLGARLVAAKLLAAIVDARTSADGLLDPGNGHPGFRALEPRDQGLVRAIILTALRFRGTLDARISAALDRPLPPNALALRHILHVGAAQVLHLDVPDSAAVDLAVAACSVDSRNKRFAGMVNAVLRGIAREKGAPASDGPKDGRDPRLAPREELKGGEEKPAPASDGPKDGRDPRLAPSEELKGGEEYDPARDMPAWLFARLAAAYGEDRARAIAAAHRTPAPLDLTVKGDPAAWAERLGGIALATGTVRLAGFEGPVTGLAGFAEGQWWVQDAAAALPARLFGDVRGRRVADLCAAPGGKTAQLAAAGAKVTAFDISASRARRLAANLERLGLTAEIRVGDLRLAPAETFDAVLLDAPCSSTGTIRRHPDVAYTKDAAEIAKLAAVQAELLKAAAGFVAPGGLLVFSNCSLDPAEGEDVVASFLEAHRDFAREPVTVEELPGLSEAVTALGEVRTTPEMLATGDPATSGLDGFFAARLRRRH